MDNSLILLPGALFIIGMLLIPTVVRGCGTRTVSVVVPIE